MFSYRECGLQGAAGLSVPAAAALGPESGRLRRGPTERVMGLILSLVQVKTIRGAGVVVGSVCSKEKEEQALFFKR